MAELASAPMTAEEFLDWAESREERYELVDGLPRMMAGGNSRHDRIIVNLLSLVSAQLRGRKCVPFTADFGVRTGPRQVRRPDIGVDCGPTRDDDLCAAEPRLVIEVLSPSTREFDMFGKLEEYKAVGSLQAILLIEPNAPEIHAWFRQADEPWAHRSVQGVEAAIEIPGLGLTLPLADIYDGLDFRPRPRLVAQPGSF